MYTVLCIDDDPTVLQYLSVVLQFANYRSLMAHTAEEAERFLRHDVVDLVLLDDDMSGVPAEDLAAQAKRIQDVQVLLLSRDPGADHGFHSAIDAIMYQPFSPTELLNNVARLLPPPLKRTAS